MKKNKKGSIEDLIYIIIVLGVASLMILFAAKFIDSYNTKVQSMDVIPTEAKTAVNQVNNLYGGTIDNSFLLLVIGLCIAALILATLVVIHPVFLVFYFIFLPVIVFVGAAVSNIYQKAAETTMLASTAQKLVFISHIAQYLPYIIGTMGAILAIIMYKTWQNNR